MTKVEPITPGEVMGSNLSLTRGVVQATRNQALAKVEELRTKIKDASMLKDIV